MSPTRKATLAVLLLVLVLVTATVLTGCGSTPDTSPPGPLGISGSGWMLIIIIGLFVIGGAISDLADRPRRERRRREREGNS